MSVYGPLVSAPDVEAAMEDTLRSWIDTYLGNVERESGGRWALRQIERPHSWEILSDVEATPAHKLPVVVVEAALIEPSYAEEGRVDGEIALLIYAFAKGTARRATRDTVGAYEAAIRQLLLHQGDLGGFAVATVVGESGIDSWSPARAATIARAVIRTVVVVEAIAARAPGATPPTVPDPPPPAPLPASSPQDALTTAVNVTVTEPEEITP